MMNQWNSVTFEIHNTLRLSISQKHYLAINHQIPSDLKVIIRWSNFHRYKQQQMNSDQWTNLHSDSQFNYTKLLSNSYAKPKITTKQQSNSATIKLNKLQLNSAKL